MNEPLLVPKRLPKRTGLISMIAALLTAVIVPSQVQAAPVRSDWCGTIWSIENVNGTLGWINPTDGVTNTTTGPTAQITTLPGSVTGVSVAATGIHTQSGTIFMFDRNGANGKLYKFRFGTDSAWVPVTTTGLVGLTGTQSVAGAGKNLNKMTVNGNTLYIAESTALAVYSFPLDAATGALTSSVATVQTFTFTNDPSAAYNHTATGTNPIAGGDITTDEYGDTYNITYNTPITKAFFYKQNGTTWDYRGEVAATANFAGAAFYRGDLYVKAGTQLKRVDLTRAPGATEYTGWSGTLTDVGSASSTSSTDLTACGTANIKLTKTQEVYTDSSATTLATDQSSAKTGQYIKYTVGGKNIGDTWARVTKITDDLPAGTEYVANSAALNGTNLSLITYPSPAVFSMNSSGAGAGIVRFGPTDPDTATLTFLVKVTALSGSVQNKATISYSDASGLPSEPPDCASIPLLNCANTPILPVSVSIKGTVWDDTNGNVTIDGTPGENGTNAPPSNLTVYAIDINGKVVGKASVQPDGTYTIPEIASNNPYLLRLSNDSSVGLGATAPTASSLPTGWVNTGESRDGATETTTPGDLPITSFPGPLVNWNFGIDKLPVTDNLTVLNQTNSPGSGPVVLAPITAADFEDGSGTPKGICIETLPANAALAYNGTTITAAALPYCIPTYDPALLTVDPIDGDQTVTFTVSAVDAAGKKSAAPGTVSVEFKAVTFGASFPCDGTFYQVRSSGTQTALLKFSSLGGTSTSVWSSNATVGLNGLAFNRNDGYLYAFRNGVATRDLYQIGSSTALQLGTVVYATGGAYDLTTGFVITGATFDSAGHLFFVGQGSGNLSPSAIYRVDSLTDSDAGTAGVQIAVSQIYTFPGTVENVGDIAFGPDGNLYGATNVSVYQFALGSGTATVTQKAIPTVSGIGSAFFDSNYNFYAYANASQTLYNVKFSFGSSFATDPATSSNAGTIPYSGSPALPSGIGSTDGASCTLPSKNVSGRVWEDSNGTVTIDGTPAETGTNAGGLSVYALNSSGIVVAKATVGADGTYTLFGLSAGNYTLRLSTDASKSIGDAAPTAPSLPSGWVNTGENLNGTPETLTPGDIAVTVAAAPLANLDFGIEKTPTANAINASSQANPGSTTLVNVPNLGGSDPEDGTLGTGSTIIISSLATNGTLYYNGTAVTLGQVISGYDPSLLRVDPDNGAVTVGFTYQVRDAAGKDSATATVSMPFTNLPPVASDVTNPSIAINAAATSIDVLQATDPDDGVASYTVVTLPNAAHGTLYLADGTTAVTAGQVLTLAQASSLKFDPSGTYVGDTNFTFTATDFNGVSDASAATFTIPIGNTPPVATAITTSSIASSAAATAIDALAASDSDGTIASFTVSTLPPAAQGILYLSDGTTAVTLGQVLTPAQAATLTFDPSGTYTGNVTFTFTATDNNSASDTTPATYTIPVGNNPPVATDVTNPSLSVGAGPTTISSLAATDTDGTIFSYTVSTLPPAAQGTLYLADGTTAVTAGQVLTPAQAAGLKFDPSGTFSGNVNFTYTATDNLGAIDLTPATYTIPVTNVPPIASDVTTSSIPSSAAATTIDPLAATDSDGTIVSFTLVTLPPASEGILYLADGTTAVTAGQVLTPAQASGLKFDPAGTFTGSSTFTFTATDNLGLVDLSAATYTIPVGNTPPVALDVTNANIAINAGPTTLSTGLAATDADGTIASYTVATLPPAAQGVLYLADGVTAVTAGQVLSPAQTAGLKFDPSGTFVGDVTFTYRATDNNSLIDTTPATYTIPVVNQPPVATNVTTSSIPSSAGATAIDPLAATDTDGTISSFTVSTLPAAAQGVLYLADGTTAVTVGQVLTPAQASSLKFDPSGTNSGNVSFTFTATDNNAVADSSPATYTIPVTNVPPVATNVTTSSIPSSAGSTAIDPLSATDADGLIVSFTVSSLPPASQGVLLLGVTPVTVGQVLTPAQALSLSFDPNPTFTGNATFTFTATDNLALVDASPATYTIPVGNNPPVASDVTNAAVSVGAGPTILTTGLAATDTDGTIANYTISSLPLAAQGTLFLADGTTPVTAGQVLTPAQAAGLKFDPSGTFSGNVNFTYTATDNLGEIDLTPATYTFPVTNVPPIATDVTTSSIPSSAAATTIDPLAATDSDGTIVSFTVVTLPPASEGILYLADGTTALTAGQVLTPAQASGLKFDPAGTFTGVSTFTFTATDNLGLVDSSPALYSIPVGNNPPVAQTITNSSLSVAAGPTTLVTGLAATDADGTIANYTVLTLPPAAQGTLLLADGLTAVTAGQVLTPAQAAGLRFDPSGTFSGDVTFTYTATDNAGLTDSSPAVYTIPLTNTPPVATNVTTSSLASSAGPTAIDPLAATDTDGTVASFTVVSLPPAAQGVLYLADGTTPVALGQILTPAQAASLKFDPSGTFVGNVNFTFTATDNLGLVDPSAATYTIPVGNVPPVPHDVTNPAISVSAGPTTILGLDATDSDGTISSFTVVTLPPAAQGTLFLADGTTPVTAGLVLTPAQAASLRFDPSGTFSGISSFTFNATDNDGATGSSPATFSIPLGNNPPVANSDTNTAIPSSAGASSINALTATDTDGTVVSYTVLTLPPASAGVLYLADGTTAVIAGQVLTLAQAASLTFDPVSSFTGNATFTFTATDNTGATDPSAATITIPVGNNPPVANDVNSSAMSSSAGPTAVLPLNGTDTDGTIASFTVLSLPPVAQGVLLMPDGVTPVTVGQILTPAEAANLKFDPSGSFNGNVTFTYTTTDNLGAIDSSAATVTIPVTNTPPVATDVNNSSIPSNAGPTTINPLAATDADGTVVSYTISSLPPASQGVVYLADGLTPVTVGQVLTPAQAATLKFDPSGTYTGPVTFTFTATDDSGATDPTPATVTIPVGNVPPVATDTTNPTGIASSAGPTNIVGLVATDPDGTIASYTVVTLPPAAQGVLFLADGTTAVTAGQVLTLAQASSLKFDPSGTYTGNVTFTFTATDNQGLLDATPATYAISVGNNPPVVVNTTGSSIPSNAGPSSIGALTGTDSDGTVVSITVVTLPPASQGVLYLADGVTPVTAGQVLTPAQAAGLKFDPSGTYTGPVTFDFTATDNSGTSATPATFTIPVTNTPPVATNINASSIPSSAGPTAIPALAATDADGSIASYTVVTLPVISQGILYLIDGVTPVTAGQVLTPAQAAGLKFDPAPTFSGNATFTFTATDNNGLVDASPATVTIPVGNTPPVANNVTNPVLAGSAGPTTISSLDATDADGTIASYTVVTLPPVAQGTLFLADGTTPVTAGQVLTPAQAATLKFDPSGTFSGNVTFTFTATDNSGTPDATPATYTIPVGNNPPVAIDVNAPTMPSSAGPTTIPALGATDSDGTIASFTVVTLPTAAQGVLYLADGVTPVTLGQILTPAQAATLKFDPAPTFSGNATFTFTATDNNGAPDATPATVTIPVGNTPPTATPVIAPSLSSSAGPTGLPALTGTDPDGTVSSITVTTLPAAAQGVLSLNGTPVTAGQVLTPAEAANLKFDPAPTFTGDAGFQFTVTDNSGNTSSPANVTIPVIAGPRVTKTFASSTVAADGSVAMTITITNPNSSAMNGVAFSDVFPAGLEIAATPTVAQCGGTVSSTATSLSLSGGTIAANSSCTITATVKPTKIGAITNTLPAGAVSTSNAGSSPAPASATLETASVGAAKSASVINNGDGTYDITYLITLQNLGSVPLSNVQAIENLENTITGTATWSIVGTPSISGTGLTLNPGFTGRIAGSTNLLTAASSNLAVGATSTLSVTVRVNPNGNPVTTAYNNQVKATATGNGPGGATPSVSDLSSNSGTNPDPNGNGNPNEPGESDPTGVSFSENPVIGAAKSAGALTSNGNGTYTQAFTVTVRNYGDVPLSNLNVTENLSSVFGTALVSTSNLTVTGAAGVSANASFNGVAQTNLAATGSTLAVGATATFIFDVVIRPSATASSFTNSVIARGSSPAGSIIADDSVNGLDPNPTPGTPGNDTSGTPIVFAKVTGHVFSDINGNGTQEASEPNLNGDTVTVTPVTGLAFTILTDTNGDYTAIVPVGNTKLEATAPVGNAVTTANNPQTVNAVAGSNASTPVGFQPKGTIKGHVWTDLNAGGSQQPIEPNANGLTVTITDSSGATQTVTTDANGDYTATVPFGPVTATVTLPPGSRLTTANNPQTLTITDTSVQTLSPVGYHQDGLITGLIFEDLDGNGVQNAGENGLSGIPVKITDSTGKVVTVLTDGTGAYSLAVPAGSTTVEVITPGGTLLTTANGTQNVTAVSKTNTPAAKIGFQPQNKVVGHVFNDPNGNGIQDAGETNIANQNVSVTDSSGAVQTVKTNATGDYVAFVIPGKTTVNVVDPSGSSLTTANDPQDVTVLAGQTSTATPVGFQARGTLSGHIFNDVDGNGVQNPGEPNLPGLSVTITDSNGAIITLISDANGDYATSVPVGSTTVSVAGPNGAIATTGNNPQTVTVPVGGNVNSTPIGFQVQSGSLNGLVFNDTNGNGLLDNLEQGIEGVRVTVLDSSGQTFNLITDANGNYNVPSLATGSAKITVTDPSGLALTTNNNEQTLGIPSGSSASAANVGYVKPSLQLSKRALSPQVAIGEILEYELVVTNSSPIDVRDVVIIDELPLGLAYKAGSSTVAGLKLEPKLESKNGRQILTWTVPGILTPSASGTIKFATVVTPSATQKLENVATASAIAGTSGASTLKVAAQSAVATTKIVQAVFNNKSMVVGRVYFDRDRDANFTSGTDVPLAGARVYLSDGRYAITDAQGRYSVPDIAPGVYVIRLDRLTAPYTPVRVPTDVGLPGTRRVDAQGGLYEANFPLLEPDANVAKERETMVERGSVKLEKILERIPASTNPSTNSSTNSNDTEKPGYVIRETVTVSKTIANLTITDPLPPGATRGPILLVGSDGKEITVTLLEDGRIQIPGKLEAGTYTLVYTISTTLTPDQVVTDPSINYDEVIR